MTLDAWVQDAALRLAKAGVEQSLTEARLLAAFALDRDKVYVMTHGDREVHDLEQMERALTKRLARYPLAYIVGEREFYGRRFAVDPSVLIPRPETEKLIDLALELLPETSVDVLDLGTGSGCIAITLKCERQAWSVAAVDISLDALALAQSNSERLQAEVEFAVGDLFDGVPGRQFDLLVSNPPYIEKDYPLQPEVGLWEPRLALFAGEDGLAVYRRIAESAHEVVKLGGWILLELGAGQAEAVAELFADYGPSTAYVDLAGIPRVLAVRRQA